MAAPFVDGEKGMGDKAGDNDLKAQEREGVGGCLTPEVTARHGRDERRGVGGDSIASTGVPQVGSGH
jgi:hypothetical protein